MICCQVKGKVFSQSIWQFWLKILAVTVLKPGVRICLMIILWYNYYVNFTISLKYGYCNFLKISHDNIPILAFHGPVKAKLLYNFVMGWQISPWTGVFYAIYVHSVHPTIILCLSYSYFMNFAELLDQICACKILQILCDISHQFPKYCVISCGSKKFIAHECWKPLK